MIRDHAQCLFASAPITDCGRDMRLPEPVLASHWPLAFIGFLIIALAVRTFLRALPARDRLEPRAGEEAAPASRRHRPGRGRLTIHHHERTWP
jgi:hypothetical protein